MVENKYPTLWLYKKYRAFCPVFLKQSLVLLWLPDNDTTQVTGCRRRQRGGASFLLQEIPQMPAFCHCGLL